MLDIESPSTTRSKLKHLGTPPTNSLVRVDFLKENILLRFLVKPPCDLCCFVGGSKKPSGKKYAKVKLHHFANKNRGVKIFFGGKKRKKNTTCRPCFWISFPPPPMTRWPFEWSWRHPWAHQKMGNHHTPEKSQPNVLSIYRWSLTGWLGFML